MRNLIIAFALAATGHQLAIASPAGRASRLFVAEFEGTTLKATQFIEYQEASFATCNSLLSLAEGLSPRTQTTVRSCGIDLPAPDGSPPRTEPSPDDFYITYEEPALRNHATRTFTVYRISSEQANLPETCSRLIAQFHAGQVNVRCHAPRIR